MARKSGSDGKKTARELREAATRLFAKYGYAAVSMRQIAAEVGVQAGALYLYTPDKQTLLYQIMDRHMDDLLGAWMAEPAGIEDDPMAKIEQFVRFHIRFHLDRGDEIFIAYMELRNLTEENFILIEQKRRQYEGLLGEILKTGNDSGRFSLCDTKLSSYAIIAMLTGVSTWYSGDGRLSLDKIEEIYLCMVRGLVSQGGPKTQSSR
ncbi:MAG TPA: TetR/AcrR family transcriptional regulator [Rhodobacteraceae bacterium]|nr:TetR/AcrR family transcriptional regulator [Paracoccaceae bacterium]